MSSFQNKDQFGFYRVGDLKFYSKVEAIEMHSRTGMHPHWDFNEDVFSLYDWTKEPAESLSELYRRRAQQLRDEYDYLVLWYSSGADSHNVLQSFLDNDIMLDEVASFVNYEGTHDRDDFHMNGEIYNVAAKNVKQYQEKYPDLKYQVIDICQPIVDFFSQPNTMLDWKYSQNTLFSNNSSVRWSLFRKIEHWQNLINSGKKVGFIWGKDKPRLSVVDGKYCFRFVDVLDDAMSATWQNESKPGEFFEFFYWTPDMPEIMIKQAHVVKNYLKSATDTSPFMGTKSTGLGFVDYNGTRLWISTIGVNTLVYPGYQFNPLNEYKPAALFWSSRDKWFHKLSKSDDAYKLWKNALRSLWKDIPDYWKNNPADPKKAFKGSISKPYFLE